MRKLLASLFEVEIVNEHDVAAITGGAKPLSHALAALKPVLEKQEDVPKVLFETQDGWILAGDRSAVLMGDDGKLVAKSLPKADEEAHMASAAKVNLQKLKAALDKGDVEEAKELLKKAMTNVNIAAGKKVGAKMEGLSLTTVMNAVASQLKPDADAKVIGEAVEAAKSALVSKLAVAGKTQVMAESLNEMAISPSYPYNTDNLAKVGGCQIEVYGPTIRFTIGDLIKEAPNYAIADFVVEKALRSVIEGDTGTALVDAVKAALKDSDKIAPLEISLKESTDEVEITEVESFAQVMVGEGQLELRAGKDGDGEVLVTVECDTKDDEAVAAALDTLNAKAADLGYVFVEGGDEEDDEEDDEDDEEDDEDDEEDDETDDEDDEEEVDEALQRIQDVATQLVIEHGVDFGSSIAALDRAVAARDLAAARAAVELMAEAAGVTLDEGFATKKRSPGRKPSGKTFVKKAVGTSIKPPRLPVDVGPGARAGGSTGGAADAGTKNGTRVEQSNPASHVKESTRHGGLKKWRPGKLAATKTDPPANGKDNAVDFSDEDAVNEWVGAVQRMSVDEFMENMIGYVSEDSLETFAARLTALTEAYKCKPGKKDMARKLTAANPLIKKKTGKGLDLESVEVAATKEIALVEFAPINRDAFFAAAKAAGVPDDALAYVIEGQLRVEVPKTCVRKLTAVLGTDDFKFIA